jgi:hypothetical protein
MANRPGERIGYTSPPGLSIVTKTIQVTRSDTTAFSGFILPKGVVVSGVYIMGVTASDAGTTATVSVGSNPGTTNEILATFNVKGSGQGYYSATGSGGTGVGQLTTSDLEIKAKYTETGGASTTGGPWLVKVEYYYPQSGNSW